MWVCRCGRRLPPPPAAATPRRSPAPTARARRPPAGLHPRHPAAHAAQQGRHAGAWRGPRLPRAQGPGAQPCSRGLPAPAQRGRAARPRRRGARERRRPRPPRPAAPPPQVGLAGPSGSGKTAFSEKIQNFIPGCAILSMDNYNDGSKVIDGNFDGAARRGASGGGQQLRRACGGPWPGAIGAASACCAALGPALRTSGAVGHGGAGGLRLTPELLEQ